MQTGLGHRSQVLGHRSWGCTAMATSRMNLEEEIAYKYVTKRWPGNASRMQPGFYAQFRGKSAGPFNTQKDAAKAASAWSGKPLNNLRKFTGPEVQGPGDEPRLSCTKATVAGHWSLICLSIALKRNMFSMSNGPFFMPGWRAMSPSTSMCASTRTTTRGVPLLGWSNTKAR